MGGVNSWIFLDVCQSLKIPQRGKGKQCCYFSFSKCLPYIAIIPSIPSSLFPICLAFDPRSRAAGLESVDSVVWIRECDRTAVAHMLCVSESVKKAEALKEMCSHIVAWHRDAPAAASPPAGQTSQHQETEENLNLPSAPSFSPLSIFPLSSSPQGNAQ